MGRERMIVPAVLAVVLVPGAIAAAAGAVSAMNGAAQMQRYTLPAWLFWVYAGVACASPLIGIAALVARRDDRRVRWGAAAALLSPVAWYLLAGTVFFASGGLR